MELESTSQAYAVSPTLQSIVIRVGNRRFAIPEAWVIGLLLVERSQVLALPFYPPAILGVIHHQGKLVPLVQLHLLTSSHAGPLLEAFSVVQLNHPPAMAGVGLTIDQVVGSLSEAQIAADSTIEPLPSEIFDASLCQPQRWRTLAT